MIIKYQGGTIAWAAMQADWDLGMPAGMGFTKRAAFFDLMEQLDNGLEHRMLWAVTIVDKCPHFGDIYKMPI